MQVGKLYQIKKFFWFLFPSKDIATTRTDPALLATSRLAVAATSAAADVAAANAAYFSKHFKCNVTYLSPETILFPVEIDGRHMKIVSGEGVGWIIYPENDEWTKGTIEEVKE